MTGLWKVGPGLYIEECEAVGFVVLVNRVVSRREGGTVCEFQELAAFPTLAAARAYADALGEREGEP